jgi:hypothetical protein
MQFTDFPKMVTVDYQRDGFWQEPGAMEQGIKQ